MSALRACPFCRTLYRPDEGSVCADCGVGLVPMHSLPPPAERDPDEPEPQVLPEDATLSWSDFGRGRGLLLAFCVLGLCAFFTPWVEVVRPELSLRSGFDLARGRAGWLWGGAAAYFVLIPFVFTRRTIARMRGVRIVTVMLSSLTALEVVMLLLLPPRSRGPMPVHIEWRWGIYASFVVSLVATVIAARFGGALPQLRGQDGGKRSLPPPLRRADGETIH
ncbi:MAG: hypothetical protein QM756_29080 [Polyangiaceae bacterium]